MLPLRLVIDTNILVSAEIKPPGQRIVRLLAISRPDRLYVSRSILEEYGEVLGRQELRIRKGPRAAIAAARRKPQSYGRSGPPLGCPKRPRRQYVSGMRRCRPCGLSGDGQSEAFPEILGESQDHNDPRIHWPCRASFNKKAGSSTFGRHHCCPGILQFKRQGFCDI